MAAKLQHMLNLRQIFQKSVESVRPVNLLSETNNYCLRPRNSDAGNRQIIQLQGKKLDITSKRCHVVGFGKAVLGMAVQLERALDKRIVSGVLSIPSGTLRQFQGVPEMQLNEGTKIEIVEGAANNQPDEKAQNAARQIKEIATKMGEEDVLFVLISGGGSALLPLPRPSITLSEKMILVRDLANRGASIEEMNLVRIALSDIKGGKLAAAAHKAYAVISFVVSDIVGDPVDLIASGPTCSPLTKRTNAVEVLRKYNMWQGLSAAVRQLIELPSQEGEVKPGPNNAIYVVGDNRVATYTAIQSGVQYDYNPFIASTILQGDVQQLVTMYVELMQNIYRYRRCDISEHELKQRFPFDTRIFEHFVKTLTMCEQNGKPLLLITAGEPTIKVTGNGLGGRNQELALRMSMEFHRNADFENVCFLSAGTDGIDGPTPAAGALAGSFIIDEYLSGTGNTLESLNIYLSNNDSFNFYNDLNNGEFHVITGHTGTNVMDLQFLIMPWK